MIFSSSCYRPVRASAKSTRLFRRFAALCRSTRRTQGKMAAALHSVRIAHQNLIRPGEWRAVDGVITTN
jgi:uncharacterized protein Usg